MHLQKHFWAAVACAGTLTAAALPGGALVRRAVSIPLRGQSHFQMAATNIYSNTADAHEDIRQALLTAGATHKHVLLVFGGNWCLDCHALDLYLHDPGNASLLAANYVPVNVNIGEYDKNLGLARKYDIPLDKGVPALVVLDGSGRVLYAQRNGEFEAMRRLDSSVVTTFLQKWKPTAVRRQAKRHPSSK
jgi:thiol:disulfide interchange protein